MSFDSRQSSTILLAVLAAFAGVLVVQSKSVGPDDSKPGQPKPDGAAAAREAQTPLSPIRAFLRTETPEPSQVADCFQNLLRGLEAKGPKAEWQSLTGDYKINFLIATVPDPIESRFDYTFDQVVESLQRALEQAHYVVDRSWLPWPPASEAQRATVTRDRPWARQPGLVLFRRKIKDSATPDLLALFLVGETPTSGLHKEAFTSAVK